VETDSGNGYAPRRGMLLMMMMTMTMMIPFSLNFNIKMSRPASYKLTKNDEFLSASIRAA